MDLSPRNTTPKRKIDTRHENQNLCSEEGHAKGIKKPAPVLEEICADRVSDKDLLQNVKTTVKTQQYKTTRPSVRTGKLCWQVFYRRRHMDGAKGVNRY